MFRSRKIISLLLGAAVTATGALALPVSAAGMVTGDANGDGMVNSADASAMLAYYASVSSGEDGGWSTAMVANCDLDCSGGVDAADASAALAYYSYLSTIPEGETVQEIRAFTAKLTGRQTVLAPDGLDPGKAGTMKYLVNTVERTPHDKVPLYNIKEDKMPDGVPVFEYYVTISAEDKQIMEDFAAKHFKADMTNYDRLEYTWNWLHENVTYADGKDGRPTYNEVWPVSYVKACFVMKAGQCIQYNGAFAMMMAYMGYDSYILEQWNKGTIQHFATEAYIGDRFYSTEVGEKSYDNPATGYKWMWLFRENDSRLNKLDFKPEKQEE